MQLIIAAVGHKMPAWIETGFAEYAKRMPPELRIVLKEIKPVERSGSKTAPPRWRSNASASKPCCRRGCASSRSTSAART
jgi:23S rRNA pseudoU1915 N3-methylase RlmH